MLFRRDVLTGIAITVAIGGSSKLLVIILLQLSPWPIYVWTYRLGDTKEASIGLQLAATAIACLPSVAVVTAKQRLANIDPSEKSGTPIG